MAIKHTLFLGIILLVAGEAFAKEPIELLCQTQHISCSEKAGTPNECLNFDKSEWLIKLKAFLGKSLAEQQTYLIDEAKGIVQINGFSYPTRPNEDGTTYVWVLLELSPIKIDISLVNSSATVERITVNRINGEILRQYLSTDGSISEVPLHRPYAQDFGYCHSDISRKF